MKLLDKLKNALFEEEYVEVEEKKEVKKKEKPIAKKIIVEDKPKKQTSKEDLIIGIKIKTMMQVGIMTKTSVIVFCEKGWRINSNISL